MKKTDKIKKVKKPVEEPLKEPTTFKPKMRITLLDEKGIYLQDRLVDAYTELLNGPKFKHKGPVRLEVTLTSQQDIDGFKKYMDQLLGDLPIKEPSAGRGRPSATAKAIETPREDVLNKIEEMVKEGKNQVDIIKSLRELGFVFILTEDLLYYFPDFPFEKKDIGEPNNPQAMQYPDSYSWLIRCIRRGKDPKTDKFDPMLIFGFKVGNETSRKVIPYLYKERKNPLRVIPPKKALSFSDVEFTKFPKYQTAEERIKWSTELRQLLLNKDKKPSKFFIRWALDVEIPKANYEVLSKRYPNLKFKNDYKAR